MAWTRSVMLCTWARSKGTVGSRWSEKPSCSSVRTPEGWADSIAAPSASYALYAALFTPGSPCLLGGVTHQVQSTLHTHGRHDTAATGRADGPVGPAAYAPDPTILRQ